MERIYSIKDMHCNSCATLIEKELKDKVNKIYVSFAEEEAIIDFDENKITEKEVIEAIHKLGYEAEPSKSIETEKIDSVSKDISEIKLETKKIKNLEKEIEKKEGEIEEKEEEIKTDVSKLKNKEEKDSEANDLSNKIGWIVLWSFIGIIVIGGIYYIYNNLGLLDIQIPELGERTSLLLLFFAGILTGFHCISMCGGFVMSYTAKNAIRGHKSFSQHLVYGGSKVVSYAVIGGIFGLMGGFFAFSTKLRGAVAILAGLFMIFYSLNMFGFKFFRRFQFNPKFLTNAASEAGASAKGPYKAPLVTGLLNGLFIACGPLQAMYLYAAGTGSFFSGATSLFVFGLGTLPVMFGFGSLATVISHKTTAKILKISAIIVLVLGLIMLNRGLALTGSTYSYDAIKTKIIGVSDSSKSIINNGIQEINMQVDSSGYSPNSFVLKKGVLVKWNINAKQLTGCNNPIIVPEYDLNIKLKQGINTIEFTPDKIGTFSFSCWMGMLRGTFIVTETGQASQQEIRAATPSSGGTCGGGGGCGCGG